MSRFMLGIILLVNFIVGMNKNVLFHKNVELSNQLEEKLLDEENPVENSKDEDEEEICRICSWPFDEKDPKFETKLVSSNANDIKDHSKHCDFHQECAFKICDKLKSACPVCRKTIQKVDTLKEVPENICGLCNHEFTQNDPAYSPRLFSGLPWKKRRHLIHKFHKSCVYDYLTAYHQKQYGEEIVETKPRILWRKCPRCDSRITVGFGQNVKRLHKVLSRPSMCCFRYCLYFHYFIMLSMLVQGGYGSPFSLLFLIPTTPLTLSLLFVSPEKLDPCLGDFPLNQN